MDYTLLLINKFQITITVMTALFKQEKLQSCIFQGLWKEYHLQGASPVSAITFITTSLWWAMLSMGLHPWVGKTVTQTEDLIIMQQYAEENYPQNSMGMHTGRDRLGFNLEDQERLAWVLKTFNYDQWLPGGREREGWTGRAQQIFRVMKLFWMTL